MESLSKFNFLGEAPKANVGKELITALDPYKGLILTFMLCVFFLVGVFVFFQMQLKFTQDQYVQLSSKEGVYLNQPQASIQSEVEQNIDKLAQYKAIRTKSDVAMMILRVASHLPKGAMINELDIKYEHGDTGNGLITIDMKGDVFNADSNEQIAIVKQVYSDIKNDSELAHYVKSVNLVSFSPEVVNDRQVTGFNIHCS